MHEPLSLDEEHRPRISTAIGDLAAVVQSLAADSVARRARIRTTLHSGHK